MPADLTTLLFLFSLHFLSFLFFEQSSRMNNLCLLNYISGLLGCLVTLFIFMNPIIFLFTCIHSCSVTLNISSNSCK